MSDSLKWSLLGLLMIILGVIILANTAVASLAIATMTGALLLTGGIFQIVAGFSVEGMSGKAFAWLMGALMAFLGWSFLSHPLAGVLTLSTMVLILIIAGGITRIFYAFSMKGTGLFWAMLISGILSLVLAGIILSTPSATFQLLSILLGVEMLFDGTGLITMGMFVKTARD